MSGIIERDVFIMAIYEGKKIAKEIVFDSEQERNEAEAAYEYCSSAYMDGGETDSEGNDVFVNYYIDFVVAC